MQQNKISGYNRIYIGSFENFETFLTIDIKCTERNWKRIIYYECLLNNETLNSNEYCFYLNINCNNRKRNTCKIMLSLIQ